MRLLIVYAYAALCTSRLIAAAKSNPGADASQGLSLERDENDWDENTVANYLQELIQKHGAKVRQEGESYNPEIAEAESLAVGLLASHESRKWHVGKATLEKFDEPRLASMVGKLRQTWPFSRLSMPKWDFSEIGLFILSVGDTDIFEDL